MAVYVMADTHLSLAAAKPMDVFGARWRGHAEKIRTRWCEVVSPSDTVVIPGDLSWGIKLSDALPDLHMIDDLPGKKILLKGNHDYWWETVTKMRTFFAENGITTLDFLHNSAYRCEDMILCGSRGWYTGDKKVVTANEIDTKKIVAREVGRLRVSLEAGRAIQKQVAETEGVTLPMPVFLHFPPYFKGYVCEELIDVMEEYGVHRCFFGHIHGTYDVPADRFYRGICFSIISADYLQFRPRRVEAL